MNGNLCCGACGTEAKTRYRDFSTQTWALLLAWGEISKDMVEQLLCDDCYRDLRDLLIERSEEVEALLSGRDPLEASTEKKTPNKKKVRAKIAS